MDRAVIDRAGLTVEERNCVLLYGRHHGRVKFVAEDMFRTTPLAARIKRVEALLDSARQKLAAAARHIPPTEEERAVKKLEMILEELERRGTATAAEVADALGWGSEATGTMLSKLCAGDPPRAHRAGQQPGGPGRPRTIFAPGPPPPEGAPSPAVESPVRGAPPAPGAGRVAGDITTERPGTSGKPPQPATSPPAGPDGNGAGPATGAVPVPLVAFVYLLMRDYLPTGKVKTLIDQAEGLGTVEFSAPELEQLAERYGRALLGRS